MVTGISEIRQRSEDTRRPGRLDQPVGRRRRQEGRFPPSAPSDRMTNARISPMAAGFS
jgi:hypothetical protein